MKMESQKRQEHVLFLATEKVILHVNRPYRIRQDMIESKNFIPEAFLMHQFHDSSSSGTGLFSGGGIASGLFLKQGYDVPLHPGSVSREETAYFSDDEDDKDDDWNDEDEDWDEDDEDWDEEDEDWDDEDEDWDEDDEDFDEDEEDWSDEEDE